jgi:hypothetical protein
MATSNGSSSKDGSSYSFAFSLNKTGCNPSADDSKFADGNPLAVSCDSAGCAPSVDDVISSNDGNPADGPAVFDNKPSLSMVF